MIDPKSLTEQQVREEAEKRAKFIRGMGGLLVGYHDGYADGFEHALLWLLGKAEDPLALNYRPDSGMGFNKKYYATRPEDRKKLLLHFKK